ncbi:MAG: 50S ribosomal protein L15 [Phycisphaerae bacterium]|nr:50S ribosomal protein L15 [Phycisphaerae bacterium]
MNLAEITREAGADKGRKRVGRGRSSGHGKTCGRGHKGGGQRSGWRQRGLQEGGQTPIFRRTPKRGFSNAAFRQAYAVVNLSALEARFDAGTHVTAQLLREAGLIGNAKDPVKILGDGNLTKKLTIDAAKFSKSAMEKIQAAGGEARVKA